MKQQGALAIMFFLIVGMLGGQDNASLSDVKQVLRHTANYCDVLRKTAFRFVCYESVKETVYYKYGRAYYSSTPPLFKLSQPLVREYRYSYNLLQGKKNVHESRVLIERDGKKIVKENAALETRFQHQMAVFGPHVFSREQQPLYDFKLRGQERIHDCAAWVVDVMAKPGRELPFFSSTCWIDAADFTIHKITHNQRNIKGFPMLEKIAYDLQATPDITIVQEYNVLKNGIRFPTRIALAESYRKGKINRMLVSQVEIEYMDYQFFKVELSVDEVE